MAFAIIEDLCDGLSNWMDAKGFKTVSEIVGQSLPQISNFANFDLSFSAVARIDTGKCIKCNLCYVACNDTAHQCIDLIEGGERPSAATARFASRIASDAAYATTSVRWSIASRWRKFLTGAQPYHGASCASLNRKSPRTGRR